MGLLRRIVSTGARLGLLAEKEVKKVARSKKVRKTAKKVATISLREGKKLEAELKKKLRELEKTSKTPKKKTAKKKTKRRKK